MTGTGEAIPFNRFGRRFVVVTKFTGNNFGTAGTTFTEHATGFQPDFVGLGKLKNIPVFMIPFNCFI